jgi:AcrR family transcriptional regulator
MPVAPDRPVEAPDPATRATFYRHFPAQEDLVEAYLRATDAYLRAAVAGALDQASQEQSAAAPPASVTRRSAGAV